MRAGNQFWWFALISIAVTLAIISSISIFFWRQLTPDAQSLLIDIIKDDFGYVFAVVFLIIAGLGFALDGIFHTYILPVIKLKEEVSIINSANPAHRIQIEGNRDVLGLAAGINESANRYQTLHREVEQRIADANAEIDADKNILAAFVAELPEGVIICNVDGQILLYNRQAKTLLTGDHGNGAGEAASESGKFIGLGRSIFGLIDRNLILHVLDEMVGKLKRKDADACAYFALVEEPSRSLRVEAVPVLNPRGQLHGFILILFDITRRLESSTRTSSMFQSLVQRSRASLASIRSAIEAILEYPEMQTDQLQRFRNIIHKEAVDLGCFLDKKANEFPDHLRTHWPLVRTGAKGFLETIRQKAESQLGVRLDMIHCDPDTAVKIDTYSLQLALLFLLAQLQRITGQSAFNCELRKKERLVHLYFIWEGRPLREAMLHQLEEQVLSVGDERIPMQLKTVIGHHEAELWSHSRRHDTDQAYIRLVLPSVVDTIQTIRGHHITLLPESRPEFYDFDLFHQPGQIPELEDCLLTELTYTVFDTETTGLNPTGGDEIISLGAVRIVNGRLLGDDVFDQLVNPQRSLSRDSIRIHGIQEDMLIDQPTIETVLPLFHRFAEGTILVAHNAAFDMRMLQVKEGPTGVRFINPVLDTMLLSAVVHPAQESHNIEDIALRMGISIIGRHTALGDAMATGEIFLKLLPLLAKQGIQTLKDAILAAEKTYLARKKY